MVKFANIKHLSCFAVCLTVVVASACTETSQAPDTDTLPTSEVSSRSGKSDGQNNALMFQCSVDSTADELDCDLADGAAIFTQIILELRSGGSATAQDTLKAEGTRLDLSSSKYPIEVRYYAVADSDV